MYTCVNSWVPVVPVLPLYILPPHITKFVYEPFQPLWTDLSDRLSTLWVLFAVSKTKPVAGRDWMRAEGVIEQWVVKR